MKDVLLSIRWNIIFYGLKIELNLDFFFLEDYGMLCTSMNSLR